MARTSIERNISYDTDRRRYYVLMDQGRAPDGGRRKHYETFETLAQARRALRAFQTRREREKPIRREVTVAGWLRYWMGEMVLPSRAQTTSYGYRKIVENHLIPELGDIPLHALRPQDIQRYYARLLRDKGLSPCTVRHHHDVLSASFGAAVRQGALAQSPLRGVEPPRGRSAEARFYDLEGLRRLCRETRGTRLELVIKLAAGLGLRREEICGLRWVNVDFNRRVAKIREARTTAGAAVIEKETKNRSSQRTLYLPDDLYRLLAEEQRRQQAASIRSGKDWDGAGAVVVNDREEPYPPNGLSMAFHRFIGKRGLPPITLHGLRHTFATLASAQGAPLYDIGKALGHSTPSTTGRIYTHLLDRTHADILTRVSAAME